MGGFLRSQPSLSILHMVCWSIVILLSMVSHTPVLLSLSNTVEYWLSGTEVAR